MCGIWFYLNRSQNILTLDILKEYIASFNKIKNRGPDFSITKQIIVNNSIQAIAGFHRLAIMDLSTNGNQPFVFESEEEEIIVICNGEIYNHLELIKEHQLEPSSHSDCEVIMLMYKKYKNIEKIVNSLNGEFAFVIYHRELKTNKINLFAATDPISVRPLFIGYKKSQDSQENLTSLQDQQNLTSLQGQQNRKESDLFFSSEMKGLECCDSVERFKPGHIYTLSFQNESTNYVNKYYPYYLFNYNNDTKIDTDRSTIHKEIVNRLSNSVKKRIQSDRPLGCLLSGGLDSSLVACLLAKHMKTIDETKLVNFFSIGNANAPDVVNAITVFNHIKENINPNIKHHIFDISFEEALSVIPDVIKTIETYDITTIRASTWQYLLAKKISETTDIKVILNGDGADEIEMGYQYFKNAPSPEEAQKESEKLVRDIHLYDCLRVDRAISHHGLEARVPFLDIEFFDYYMRVPAELKVPVNGMEKYLIRKAFEIEMPELLCKEVLWRPKEAFSDGISDHKKSWFQIIQERVEEVVSDDEYLNSKDNYAHLPPVSKESYYFRKIYELNYKNRENVIKYYWLPNWCGDIKEPSARVLKVYQK